MWPVLRAPSAGKKRPPDQAAVSSQALNLLVFRECRSRSRAESLKSALAQELADLRDRQGIIRALLRSGELECAAADAGLSHNSFGKITDSLAEALVKDEWTLDSRELLSCLEKTALPEMLTVSVPEGFAYYGLHPLAYAGV